MAGRVVFTDSRLRLNLLILLVLILALLALLLAYYLIMRPAQLVGDQVAEIEEFTFVRAFYGFEGDLLSRPSGVVFGPDNRVYVADTMKHRVVVFDIEGRFIDRISGVDLGPYSFTYPVSVAVAPDGRVFVLSRQEREVIVFDQDYEPQDAIVFPDVIPTHVQIRGDTLFVVTDRAIMRGTLDGEPLGMIGALGREPGQFDLPGGLTLSPDGATLYVADTLNYRVQALDTETGEPRWVYGEPLPPGEALKYRGEGRKFGLPASIALDEMGNLYVIDGTNSQIVVLSEEGELIRTLGEVGHTEGRFYFPDGIAYGQGGYIAVADKFNDRVQIFRVPAPQDLPIAARWLPLALLPLLALLLWLLLKRRARFVAASDFLERAIEAERLEEVAAQAKRVYVTPAVHALMEGRFERPALVSVELDAKRLAEVRDRVEAAGVEGVDVEALTLAHQLKGKTVLFAEHASTARLAHDEFELVTMNLDEIVADSLSGAPGASAGRDAADAASDERGVDR